MAGLELFQYNPSDSPLHKHHSGLKIAELLLLSLVVSRINTAGLAWVSLFLAAGLVISGFEWSLHRKSLLYFFVLILLIFIFQCCSSGIAEGILRAWRLVCILFSGLLLIQTTALHSIHLGLYYILKPVPLINAEKISSGISLMVSFLPELIEELNIIMAAIHSRGGSNRRPVRKLVSLGIPFLEGILYRTENLSDAMEARCYNETARLMPPEATGNDLKFFLFFILIILLPPLVLLFP